MLKGPPSHLDLYIKLGQMQKSFFKENKPVSAMHWYSAFLIVNKPAIVYTKGFLTYKE